MLDLCRLIFGIASDLLRSQVAQQITVLRRANPKRLRFVSIDRLILGGVCRLFPKMYGALAIVRPETVIRWHRAGFRSYWRWKSKRRCGRAAVTVEICQLVRPMTVPNPSPPTRSKPPPPQPPSPHSPPGRSSPERGRKGGFGPKLPNQNRGE